MESTRKRPVDKDHQRDLPEFAAPGRTTSGCPVLRRSKETCVDFSIPDKKEAVACATASLTEELRV
jgi:hypothetical protein